MSAGKRLIGRNVSFNRRSAHKGGLAAAAVICLTLMIGLCGRAEAADTLRLGVQKTGTFAWELAVIKAEKLDAKANLDLVVTELASTEAGKIALLGGSVDLIISDWLWVARERGLETNLVFYPYSTALGALMVPGDSAAQKLDDLRGKTLGVAGGPIDKSWLLLRALVQRDGLDLKARARVVFGAPALLYEKAVAGELDANLTFWNYAVALESRGFRRLIGMDEVERRLGAKGPLAMTGYVFDESLAKTHGDALARFFQVTHQARERLASSDADWQRIGKELGVTDPKELALYRQRYVDGFPKRPVSDDEADAATLYAIVREIGGPELVGAATTLNPGVFYKGAGQRTPADR
ncbi:ABC transporter substrate-binding protein [Methylocella silvestris]|uniref:ABC transporter substrate-binding protein n=1 Tax=Methylocella silvestris TaxID=199596 RepID=A0A2J7TME1_METSI|nr:ABC transporter substrate-binding protein [Methylocella silvestris]PNG27942.1 ABC transporter substrate-binding protein [Methylocella silvestris]